MLEYYFLVRIYDSNLLVISKQGGTSCASVVNQVKYPENISNMLAVQYGVQYEKTAIQDFGKKNPHMYILDSLGLFQHSAYPHIAATPDGLIYDVKRSSNQWGVLEVKCPYGARDGLPKDAEKGKLIGKDGTISKNHKYVRQLQGQMVCVGVTWGVLVVWTPNGLYTQEVKLDTEKWSSYLSKIDTFWRCALAPEISDSRIDRGQDLRDWCFALHKKK